MVLCRAQAGGPLWVKRPPLAKSFLGVGDDHASALDFVILVANVNTLFRSTRRAKANGVRLARS